ncbi:hypothetical protein [Vibrio fluminensis]|uniref:hypothetical protein n=1 Tax=Vibrio fluminensis TaxID=2783614 RepID=UPI00188922FE|nr:hypothetical protein [Vibrio fluminensis]
MAVGPRQTNSNNRYDPAKDFTQDQLRRFGHIANQAQSHRDFEKKLMSIKATGESEPELKTKQSKPNRKDTQSLRYALWVFFVLIALLSFMYLTG